MRIIQKLLQKGEADQTESNGSERKWDETTTMMMRHGISWSKVKTEETFQSYLKLRSKNPHEVLPERFTVKITTCVVKLGAGDVDGHLCDKNIVSYKKDEKVWDAVKSTMKNLRYWRKDRCPSPIGSRNFRLGDENGNHVDQTITIDEWSS